MSDHPSSPRRSSSGGGRDDRSRRQGGGPGGSGAPRRDGGPRSTGGSRSSGGQRSSGGWDGRRDGGQRSSGGSSDNRRGGPRGAESPRAGGAGGGGRGRTGGPRNGGGFRPNRAGQGGRGAHAGPQRSGYREERMSRRSAEPALPDDVSPKELDPAVRQELRSLAKENADMVARHMIMAASLLDDDPQKALAHARAAKDRGGRVSITRETLGITAYHAGEWKEALTELRAARRLGGGPGMLAVMADCERGLGRPDKALEIAAEPGAADLDPESRAELAIVVAGAYHDLTRNEDALAALEPETTATDLPEHTVLRVTYAYADALAAAGRTGEAREWFTRAGKLDETGVLDTEERLKELP
ncbi:tetratricopeptide repeat protein [Corynebacterium bovis]|uniref:tetratricopeptide repeat protein n=2 Tax=Corynebacterium bovis TaxID=36808 RepID=UPI003CC6E133